MITQYHSLDTLPARAQELARQVLQANKVRLNLPSTSFEIGWDKLSDKDLHAKLPGKGFNRLAILGGNFSAELIYSDSHHRSEFQWLAEVGV